MALAQVKNIVFVQKILRNVCYTTLMKRPVGYKSAVSLETLYPQSSLKLTTPAFSPLDPNEKFSGYIPINKLDISYSASSGPGGQNVNKVHTKVDLRFKPSEAEWLHADIRDNLVKKHANQLTKDGYLIIRSDVTRSQQMNLADCMQKLRQIIRAAIEIKKQPSRESLELTRQRQLKAARVRVAIKREESAKKALKKPLSIHDL